MLPPSNTKLFTIFFKSSMAALMVAGLIHVSYFVKPLLKSNLHNLDCNAMKKGPFEEYSEFYPFYLCEHSLPLTKLFHFVATFNIFTYLWTLLNSKATSTKIRILIFSIVQAYGLAWFSHFMIEQNKPATFKYPVYSFFSDFVMFKDAWFGRVNLFELKM